MCYVRPWLSWGGCQVKHPTCVFHSLRTERSLPCAWDHQAPHANRSPPVFKDTTHNIPVASPFQVKRTKEILSANSAAPFSVEELLDGVDYRDSITRDEFEALAAPVVAAAAAPLAELLERNQVRPRGSFHSIPTT